MTTLLLAMLAAQPVSWTGSPYWEPNDPSMPHVRTVFHKADITLTATSATYTAKTLYKNTGAVPVQARVIVPIYGRDGDVDFYRTDVKATWGGASVAGSRGDVAIESEPMWVSEYSFNVTLKPGEWKAFESKMTRPLNKSGEGWAERFVTYLMQPTDDELEQFQLSIKYPKNLVFQTAAVSPNIGWQVGERGAFFSKKNWRAGKTSFRFQFYPGTFERIGR